MKAVEKSTVPRNVDEYLAALPDDARTTLEKIRKAIRVAAPKATEGISYGMPMYKQNGMLIGFAAFKNHCSIFPGPGAIERHESELKNYETSKGTVRFPIGKPLPTALVRTLVKERIAETEAKAKTKAMKKGKK